MSFRIYTKTGDKGETSLIGGTRLPKDHIRIETYGTVDELNSWIGMVRDHDIHISHIKILIQIQDRLFTIGSHLAADPDKNKMKLPELTDEDVVLLEKEIDRMEEGLPEMKHFILPGGHKAVSACHIARCVCRRAERAVVHLSGLEKVDAIILKYLNRLSDFLFVLSRAIAYEKCAPETPWHPKV